MKVAGSRKEHWRCVLVCLCVIDRLIDGAIDCACVRVRVCWVGGRQSVSQSDRPAG